MKKQKETFVFVCLSNKQKKGLKYKDIAKKLGMSTTGISAIFSGDTQPPNNYELIAKVGGVLGVNKKYLWALATLDRYERAINKAEREYHRAVEVGKRKR